MLKYIHKSLFIFIIFIFSISDVTVESTDDLVEVFFLIKCLINKVGIKYEGRNIELRSVMKPKEKRTELPAMQRDGSREVPTAQFASTTFRFLSAWFLPGRAGNQAEELRELGTHGDKVRNPEHRRKSQQQI